MGAATCTSTRRVGRRAAWRGLAAGTRARSAGALLRHSILAWSSDTKCYFGTPLCRLCARYLTAEGDIVGPRPPWMSKVTRAFTQQQSASRSVKHAHECKKY